jgi:O-antigen ligase
MSPYSEARPAADLGGAAALAAMLLVLALLASIAPSVALAGAGLIGLALLVRVSSARAAALVGAVALACVAAAPPLAAWPVTLVLIAVVTGIAALAWRSPRLGLAAALILFGFEGSIKILLRLEPTPLPFSGRAVGAAAIDIALLAAVVAVLVVDRAASLRAMWHEMTRAERIVVGLLGAWLVLSVLQVPMGGDVRRGLDGLRLFQLYVVVALASATVAWRMARRARANWVLAIGLAVSGYAAARVVLGPSRAEVDYATSVHGVTSYGGAVRAVGSFSSAVGMTSFLTPVAVFALIVGLLVPRVRRLAWVTAACATVAIIGSYGRAPLLGIALGLGFVLVLALSAAHLRARARLVAVALLAGVLVVAYAGVRVASESTPQLQQRAKGVLNPVSDASVQIRADTWRRALDTAVSHPLGKGVGAIGAATARSTGEAVTTDNSFLKVLVEQGFLGALLFCSAMLGTVWAIARRLRRGAGERRAVGLAALGGFIAFLGLAATGEYVEQPGKVAAWALLGVAAAGALGRHRRGREAAR